MKKPQPIPHNSVIGFLPLWWTSWVAFLGRPRFRFHRYPLRFRPSQSAGIAVLPTAVGRATARGWFGASDDINNANPQAIAGGSIVIHKAKDSWLFLNQSLRKGGRVETKTDQPGNK